MDLYSKEIVRPTFGKEMTYKKLNRVQKKRLKRQIHNIKYLKPILDKVSRKKVLKVEDFLRPISLYETESWEIQNKTSVNVFVYDKRPCPIRVTTHLCKKYTNLH
jgi:hypothetical protein